ncbi:MAG: hypothetical protein F6K36_23025 [Symploca sp. SIO3C6]|nr:hypothetical protein [Symploca sp. SIO3C6]NET08387.1 hypothetical protein [Symploca sp. SIO2B6]
MSNFAIVHKVNRKIIKKYWNLSDAQEALRLLNQLSPLKEKFIIISTSMNSK